MHPGSFVRLLSHLGLQCPPLAPPGPHFVQFWPLSAPVLEQKMQFRKDLDQICTRFGAWNHPPENIHSSSNVLRASGTTLRRTSTQKCVPRMFSGCLEPPSGEHSHRNPLQECSPGVWNHPPENIHTEMSSTNVLRVSGTTFRRTFTQNEFWECAPSAWNHLQENIPTTKEHPPFPLQLAPQRVAQVMGLAGLPAGITILYYSII